MRMWKVDTSKMCRKHLLGEHVECHMFVGTILKYDREGRDFTTTKYVTTGLVETGNLQNRHAELVTEMLKRGYKHNKALPGFYLKPVGCVDISANEIELRRRCKECKF